MVVLFFEQKLKSFHPSKSWQRSRVALKNLPQEETGKSTEHSKSQLQEGIDFARSLLKFRFSEKATKIAPIFCGLHKNILTLLTFLPYYLLHCFGTSRRYRFCKIFIKVQVFWEGHKNSTNFLWPSQNILTLLTFLPYYLLHCFKILIWYFKKQLGINWSLKEISNWPNSLDRRPPWYSIVSPLIQTNNIINVEPNCRFTKDSRNSKIRTYFSKMVKLDWLYIP